MSPSKSSGGSNPHLTLFTAPAEHPLLRDLSRLRRDGDALAGQRVTRLLLRQAGDCGGPLLRRCVIEALLDSPGAAELLADSELAAPYLEQDIRLVWQEYIDFDWDACCREHGLLPFPEKNTGDAAPDWLRPLLEADSADTLCDAVRLFFTRFRDRDEARFLAFRWEDGRLVGVAHPELQRFDALAGLEHQKRALRENAAAFLAGAPAHHVLLVGSSGTGKSSCVKATLTAFADQGLRLVELPRRSVGELPRLTEALRGAHCRYIVYIDDLSFEEVDAGYKALKVTLEGQIEDRPGNLLLYVTSNRRNLVRETWSDRQLDGEVHETDTLHEKRSLSDRFGLRLHFGALSQKEYFAAVELLLAAQGVAFTEEIGVRASAWALGGSGRSGRCAKQFVEDYLAHLRSGGNAL